VSDDLSERLRQHANYMYGIGNAGVPLTAADILAAAARIDRLQAELDAANLELRKQSGHVKAVYDRDVWDRARARPAEPGSALDKLKPLDFQRVQQIVAEAHIAFCLDKFDSYEVALIRGTERAHGIEDKP